MHLKPNRYRVQPGADLRLKHFPPDDDGGLEKQKARAEFKRLRQRLDELQEVFYADSRHALLIVLQAMDGAGKDSTIRSVFTAMNPQGVRVTSFKVPNETERQHDYLWRIHENTPRRGYIGVFNRSHYEDVLVVRVKKLAPQPVWEKRYDQINSFEKALTDEGTHVIKLFLHISKAYQKERIERRLELPNKAWKFSPSDLLERARWNHYQRAYEVALSRCSTPYAPWYVIPAEHRWYRNLLVARILVDAMESMKLRYPRITFDPKKVVVR